MLQVRIETEHMEAEKICILLQSLSKPERIAYLDRHCTADHVDSEKLFLQLQFAEKTPRTQRTLLLRSVSSHTYSYYILCRTFSLAKVWKLCLYKIGISMAFCSRQKSFLSMGLVQQRRIILGKYLLVNWKISLENFTELLPHPPLRWILDKLTADVIGFSV